MLSGTGLPGDDMDSLLESIQMLIPLGLKAVGEAMQSEVARLAGAAYSRGTGPVQRWGHNPGSVYQGKQKVPVSVPRVRDVAAGLMAIAPKLRKVSGHKHLAELREIMKRVIASKKAVKAA